MSVGIIENQDGTVKVMFAAPGYTIQEAMALAGEIGYIVPRSELPASNIPQAAWRYEPNGNTVIVDIEKLKELVIGENEKVVEIQLSDIRPKWEEAVDNDNTVLMSVIKSDRQNIRDTLATKITAINAATTEAEVLSFLP